MTAITKSTRSQRWPMDVPVAIRKELDCDTQVCAFRRLLLMPEEEAFDGQRVRLDGHLMVLVTRGNLLIERPEGARWVKEGNAVLVIPGEIRLTEFPEEAGGSVDISYFLFTTRFIRDTFLNNATVDFFANQVFSAFKDVYVLENFVPRVMPMVRANPPDRAFSTMMNYIVHGMFAVGFMFFRDAFFRPKRALDLFLEGYIGDPAGEDNAAADYPGGHRALCRNCKLFTGMTPTAWLRKRRMQIARTWIRHSDKSIEAIGGALGYRNWTSFRNDYWEAHRRNFESEERLYNLRTMSEREFMSVASPFWRVIQDELSGALRMPEMNAQRSPGPGCQKAYKRRGRKKAAVPPADDGAEVTPAPSGGVDNADEIAAPDLPGLIVLDALAADTENPTSRESFACLRSTGAEVIYFPKAATKCTDEELEKHMRSTRMWDLVAA